MVFTCNGEGEGFLTAVAEFSDLVGRQSDTTKGKTRIFLPYDSEERRKNYLFFISVKNNQNIVCYS